MCIPLLTMAKNMCVWVDIYIATVPQRDCCTPSPPNWSPLITLINCKVKCVCFPGKHESYT